MIAGAVKRYLALGDSMSIDDYTGTPGGGAVKQFHRWLGESWRLEDRTCDGCRMKEVSVIEEVDLVTLTIGGNDLLWNRDEYLEEGIHDFSTEHLNLLRRIRRANPIALFIVGDVYAPQSPLSPRERAGLTAANAAIKKNCEIVGAELAGIHDAFAGHDEYLCMEIEPSLQGATAIAGLFIGIFERCFLRSV